MLFRPILSGILPQRQPWLRFAFFGAQNVDIRRLVMREGLVLIVTGLIIGIGAFLGLPRLIANQLYGVSPSDPATIAAVATVLVVVALLASYLPSRRVVGADPLTALRLE